MCWYKIESKNILLSLQKYFIVLLTMFTFSQQIVGGNISEEIKAKFEKIKQNQRCSCCINFQDSDMQFVIDLSQKNKKLNETNEEQKKQLEERNEELKKENEEKKLLEEENKKLNETNEEQKKQLEEEQNKLEKKNEEKNLLEKEKKGLKEQLEEQQKLLEEENNKLKEKNEKQKNQLENEKNKLRETNEEQQKKLEEQNKKMEEINNNLVETFEALKKMEEKCKNNEEQVEKNDEIIKNYENEKKQIVNEKDELKGQLEEKLKELNKLNEKYKAYEEKSKEKFNENDKEINKYKNEINEHNEKINQLLFEIKNLNEQLKNFSSNVNDVDLMKVHQKADENRSREIVNIFNDKTPGQPLTDTGIFYLPFKFLGYKEKNNHKYIESEIKKEKKFKPIKDKENSKEKIFLVNNKNDEFNTPIKMQNSTLFIQNNEKEKNERNRTIKIDEKLKCFFKKDTGQNLFPISEENNEVIKITDNEFYLRANSDFPGGYNFLSLGNLNKIIFSRYSVEKRIEYPTVNIDTLKKLYLINKGATWERIEEVKNNKEKIKNKLKNKNNEENKEENIYTIKITVDKTFSGLDKTHVVEFSKCFYNSNEKKLIARSKEQNSNEQKSNVQNMYIDDGTMKKINLNYKDYIDFVNIDKYLAENEDNKKKYFLLKLDLKDPECIALLQQVGKGNYGVVKKALIFENNRYVPKAIKFTCANSEYENATKENIEKEIFAGRVARLVDPDNIAYVQNYMTINNFISRKNNIEEEIITLPGVWEEYLSQNHYEKFQEDKQNIKKCFENNVFKGNNKISGPLYIMIMDLIDGDDLFKNRDNIDINDLGDILSKVLINCSSKVALNDIKAKNIIFNKIKNKFSIIDIQTLEKTTSNLSDPLGTPEYWPFFKTLNINFEELKNVGEDNLLNIYCNTIDNNFVDTYAACMTMYFTKFHTFTAAGLLTLLLKWMVLEEENTGKGGWKNFPLDQKFEFLKEYNKNYEKYIDFVSGDKDSINKNLSAIYDIDEDNNINEINIKGEDYSDIKFFFENIDDRNLNKNQKDKLADLLKEVISFDNKCDIFYLLGKIEDQIKLFKEKELNGDKYTKIINFYKDRVGEDFKNFAKLSKENCRYDDFIKYILCFGSCLNYNKAQETSNTDKFLETIDLKKEFEKDEEMFFGNKNNIGKTINNLVSGFNQKFINDLLKIFPLDKYYSISKNFIKNRLMLEHSLEDLFPDLNKNPNELNEKMKVFYLLHLLEKNNALHVPRNLIKSFSLIKDKEEEIKIK